MERGDCWVELRVSQRLRWRLDGEGRLLGRDEGQSEAMIGARRGGAAARQMGRAKGQSEATIGTGWGEGDVDQGEEWGRLALEAGRD